ncbi:SidA/IucD/PvdA family monooxygenase [Zhihengliuella sp.]|uniref:lysine N(6)-hydroxylase/L-ornithine N(5)-oxygenase family protein n=1 Tax=Zhihengliuella sp. TaxID=1954483 RepID=UPI0028111F15|nr:SidA/IucD/PvdA family monooxygenase [Zhihengliuella sp.]
MTAVQPARHTPASRPSDVVYDAVGVGAGPFNLGFAALAQSTGLDVAVFDANESFAWHPGMMLPGTHLQVPFMADLVTLADPTHPLSFLNYLKRHGRIYPFYIREDFYALRAEYNAYLSWAAEQLPSVRFGHAVTDCRHDGDAYVLTVRSPEGPLTVRARHLVLGTGTQPYVPDTVDPVALASGAVFHTSEYTRRRPELLAGGAGAASAAAAAGPQAATPPRRIAVIGSGQSAAEVVADLLENLGTLPDGTEQELVWATRSPRFFPLEYTKLTLEMTSPDYIDHFHGLPQSARDRLSAEQKGLYKGINADLIDHLHELLYQRSLEPGWSPDRVRLLTSTALEAAETTTGGRVGLLLSHEEDGGAHRLDTDAVVLATGYRYAEPDFLAGVAERIRRLPDGRLDVDREYSAGVHGDILVQNAELHTHGFTAPDLGMGAYRNSVIVNRLAGREVYPVERRIAFQEFGTPQPAPTPAHTLQEAAR